MARVERGVAGQDGSSWRLCTVAINWELEAGDEVSLVLGSLFLNLNILVGSVACTGSVVVRGYWIWPGTSIIWGGCSGRVSPSAGINQN